VILPAKRELGGLDADSKEEERVRKTSEGGDGEVQIALMKNKTPKGGRKKKANRYGSPQGGKSRTRRRFRSA